MKKRFAVMLSASALLTAALVGVPAVFDTQQANAAVCYYDNLTSKSVRNKNCSWGAYAYKSSANASSGTRVGAWVSAGKYSYNPNMVCYAYPTMVWG